MFRHLQLYTHQGQDFERTIQILNQETKSPTNLDGYTANSSIKRSHYSKNSVANFSCSISNTSNGEITISLNKNETANLAGSHTYVFDIKTTDSEGIVKFPVEGTLRVFSGVTK